MCASTLRLRQEWQDPAAERRCKGSLQAADGSPFWPTGLSAVTGKLRDCTGQSAQGRV